MNREIYAISEFSPNSVSLAIYLYKNSKLQPVYDNYKIIKKNFNEKKEKIASIHDFIKTLKYMLKDVETLYGIKIVKVSLNINDPNLIVKKVTSYSEIKGQLIKQHDIDSLLEFSIRDNTERNQKTFLIKPYLYTIDKTKDVFNPPLNYGANNISIKSSLYMLPKKRYELYSLILNKCGISIANVLPVNLGQALKVIPYKYLKTKAILLELKNNSVKINLIENGVVSNLEIYNNIGIDSIINSIAKTIDTSYQIATGYLKKIVDLNGIYSKYFDNKIVYARYNKKTKEFKEITRNMLNDLVCNKFSEIFMYFIKKINNNSLLSNAPIFVISSLQDYSGLQNYLVSHFSNISLSKLYFVSKSYNTSINMLGLSGNAYYQHLLTKHLDTSESFVKLKHKNIMQQKSGYKILNKIDVKHFIRV